MDCEVGRLGALAQAVMMLSAGADKGRGKVESSYDYFKSFR